MRIAIDIDRTLLDCDSFLYKILNKIVSKQNVNKKLKYNQINEIEYCKECFLKYFSKIFDYRSYKIVENSSQVINNWFNSGNKIILLSSRPSSRELIKTLLIFFNKFNVKFHQIITQCNNKVLFCKEKNIDILVDNSFDICKNCYDYNIKGIWYNKEKEKYYGKIPIEAITWDEIDLEVSKIIANYKKR